MHPWNTNEDQPDVVWGPCGPLQGVWLDALTVSAASDGNRRCSRRSLVMA